MRIRVIFWNLTIVFGGRLALSFWSTHKSAVWSTNYILRWLDLIRATFLFSNSPCVTWCRTGSDSFLKIPLLINLKAEGWKGKRLPSQAPNVSSLHCMSQISLRVVSEIFEVHQNAILKSLFFDTWLFYGIGIHSGKRNNVLISSTESRIRLPRPMTVFSVPLLS